MAHNRVRYSDVMGDPPGPRWGVRLALRGGGSDKEYRIVVGGTAAAVQFGRRGSYGQCNVKTFDDDAAATKWGLAQCWSKERRGYWPVSGIVDLSELTDLPRTARDIAIAIDARVEDVTDDVAFGLAGGEHVVLCRTPNLAQLTRTSPVPVFAALRQAAASGDPTRDPYFVAAVDGRGRGLLRELCPISIDVDVDGIEVAKLAAGIVDENIDAERAALIDAVNSARLVLTCPV